MPYLKFIDDKVYEKIVRDILDIGLKSRQKAEKNFHSNVIDPFGMMIEMVCFGLETDAWIHAEEMRQAQKTISNSYGIFHQKMLGSVAGWQDLGTGQIFDLLSKKQRVIAEIKNKFNTVKGSDRVGVFESLKSQVMPKNAQYRGYTAYFVQIIPKKAKRYNIAFTPSDNKIGEKSAENNLIREIDGASFYSLVTGDPNALEKVFNTLPRVIKKVSSIQIADVSGLKEVFTRAFEQ